MKFLPAANPQAKSSAFEKSALKIIRVVVFQVHVSTRYADQFEVRRL